MYMDTMTSEPTHTDAAWQDLADAVRQRRHQLGLTQQQVSERGAVSLPSVQNVERGQPHTYRDRTLIGLARALDWKLDAASRILDGADPATLEAATRKINARLDQVAADIAAASGEPADVNLDGDQWELSIHTVDGRPPDAEALRLARRFLDAAFGDDSPPGPPFTP